MRLYVAGPATGLPDYNRPAFRAAAASLRERGFVVVDPLELGSDQDAAGWRWEHYLRRALRQMLTCHGVALLDAWQASSGATVEVSLADRLAMPAQPVQFWLERGPVEVPAATVAAAKWEVLP